MWRTKSSTSFCKLRSGEQVAGSDPERLGQPLNHGDRGVTFTALQIRHVGSVDPGAVGKFFLAPAFGLAALSQVSG